MKIVHNRAFLAALITTLLTVLLFGTNNKHSDPKQVASKESTSEILIDVRGYEKGGLEHRIANLFNLKGWCGNAYGMESMCVSNNIRRNPKRAMSFLEPIYSNLNLSDENQIGLAKFVTGHIAEIGNESAITKLDKLYVKCKSDKLRNIRLHISRSLYNNYWRKSSAQVRVNKTLEKWLQKETDPEIIKTEFKLLCLHHNELDLDILQKVKDLFSPQEIKWFQRMVKLNNENDIQEFLDTLPWLDELFKEFGSKGEMYLSNKDFLNYLIPFLLTRLQDKANSAENAASILKLRIDNFKLLLADLELRLQEVVKADLKKTLEVEKRFIKWFERGYLRAALSATKKLSESPRDAAMVFQLLHKQTKSQDENVRELAIGKLLSYIPIGMKKQDVENWLGEGTLKYSEYGGILVSLDGSGEEYKNFDYVGQLPLENNEPSNIEVGYIKNGEVWTVCWVRGQRYPWNE